MNYFLAILLVLGFVGEGRCGLKSAEAFWAEKPVVDSSTPILIGFDEKTETSLDEDMAVLVGPGQEVEAPEGTVQKRVTPKLVGDAVVIPGGRFGKGVQVSGKGAVDVAPIAWPALFRLSKGVTVDFSFKPDPDAGRAVLLDHAALKIIREADGAMVFQGGGLTETNLERAGAGVWTHVALSFSVENENARGAFSVNGHLLPLGRGAPQLISSGASLRVGGDSTLNNGFKGVVDEIRISSVYRDFYQLDSTAFCDGAGRRPIELELPYFARRGPFNMALRFDGTLIPEAQAGSVVSGEMAATAFVPGVRGQAIEVKAAAAGGFSAVWSNAVPSENGTLEFWLQPIDWDNLFIGDYTEASIPHVSLLRISGTGPAALLGASDMIFRLGRTVPESSDSSDFLPMHQGAWTHVLCSWSHGACAIYLNGKLQKSAQIAFSGVPRKTSKKDGVVVSDPMNATGPFALTFMPHRAMVDELRVYSWAFNYLEAHNAYARWFPDAKKMMSGLPPIRFEFGYDALFKNFNIFCFGMPVNERTPVSMQFTVKQQNAPEGGAAPVSFKGSCILGDGLKGEFSTNMSMPFGSFRVEGTTLAADQIVLGTTNWLYERKAPVWWHNELGITKVVPAPWTPIKVGENQVSVWGRQIELAPGGFPRQILAADSNVLAAAVRLHGEAGGKVLEFQCEPVKFGNKTAELVEWTSRSKAGGMIADVKGSMEYDGMMTFAVTLSAEAGAPALERLVVDVPFRPEVGSQLIVNGGGSYFRGAWDVRYVPAGTGCVWNSVTSKPSMQKGVKRGSFCPVVWMGDDERGVCFFGENDKGWTPGTNAPAQEIRRENGTVVYRMNVISKPVTLDKTRTFTFIIQPTPTKPLPEGWRAYNRGGVDGRWGNLEGIDACISPTLTAPTNAASHLGMTFVLEPPSWEEAVVNGEILRERAGKGNPRIFYIDYSWPKLGPSMGEYKSALWSCGRMLWTREVEDYMVWIISEYIRRDIIDGLYIDDTSFGANMMTLGTAYTMDDGEVQPGYNSMGFRRFLKRVRILFQQAGKTPMIIPHMTYCFEIPALSFADVCVNGEDRDIYYPTSQHFPEVWGKDELRIQSSSAKWGFITFWKNGVVMQNDVTPGPDVSKWFYWQSRAMHALTYQVDLGVMWANENRATIEPSIAKFDIGAKDVRFISDWKRAGIMEVTDVRLFSMLSDERAAPQSGHSNGVMVCAYAHKDRAMVMISNLSGTLQEVSVDFQPNALFEGAKGVTVRDMDLALTPPGKAVASKEELDKARQTMSLDISKKNDEPELNVDDFLENTSPEKKVKERLAPKLSGNTVRVPVREWDFRLLEVRPVW